ncbi:MAG: helix-turn-helix domain-containing protein, partial [Plesiomonas shigelloides]
MANALHLKNSMVVDIEADDFTHISNATYLRGYVKNMARYLEANPQRIAQCLARQVPVVPEPSMQSFSRKTVRQRRDTRYRLVTWLVAIALIGLMLFWWLQTSTFFNNVGVDFSKPTAEEVAAGTAETLAVKTTPGLSAQPQAIHTTSGTATDNDLDTAAQLTPASSDSAPVPNNPAPQVQDPVSVVTQAQPQRQHPQIQANQPVSAAT